MTIKCFTKNSNGYNSYFKKKDFNFKSENEWRFVPTKRQIGGKLISQNRSKYLEKQDFYNQQLEKYPLRFLGIDIEYIFVETQTQLLEIQKLTSIDKSKVKISGWSTELK